MVTKKIGDSKVLSLKEPILPKEEEPVKEPILPKEEEPVKEPILPKEKKGMPSEYKGKIMVKKSPNFRPWKGIPIQEVNHLGSEVIAVDPDSKKIQRMLKDGNLQFVSNQVRASPTGEYPKILED